MEAESIKKTLNFTTTYPVLMKPATELCILIILIRSFNSQNLGANLGCKKAHAKKTSQNELKNHFFDPISTIS